MKNLSIFFILFLFVTLSASSQEFEFKFDDDPNYEHPHDLYLQDQIAPDSMILLASCDFCTPTSSVGRPAEEVFEPGFQVGIQHQFTRYGELTLNDSKVDNVFNERINSNTTQLHLNYNFDPKLGVQLSIPYHHRSYRRLGANGPEQGEVSGLGDVVLRTRYTPVRRFSDNEMLVWNVHAGLKLPTGNSSLLRPQPGHNHDDDHGHGHDDGHGHAHPRILAHAGHDHDHDVAAPTLDQDPATYHSPVGDHDLALGSGSVDGLIGTDIFYSKGDFYLNGSLQYSLRTEGSYGYRFGDMLSWKVAPGYLFVNDEKSMFGVQLNLSGEHHDPHREHGVRSHHGYTDTIYLGPEIMAVRGENLSLAAGVDLPISYRTEGLQLAPEYRYRLFANWRF